MRTGTILQLYLKAAIVYLAFAVAMVWLVQPDPTRALLGAVAKSAVLIDSFVGYLSLIHI